MRQDHPRSRGVYHLRRIIPDAGVGSSPLARGLPRPMAAGPTSGRIIPARAGFTEGRPVPAPALGDHPRSRGVYRIRVGGRRHGPRIIPARAGFTPRRGSGWSGRRDHPRSRGVYRKPMRAAMRARGSSPLARGLPDVWIEDGRVGGIIPARAGFTHWPRPAPTPVMDHPRSRGVYRDRTRVTARIQGSSPLARGLPDVWIEDGRVGGIIPARAGFTWRWRAPCPWARDHPRSRGVYWRRAATVGWTSGSSPLARGLPYSARPPRRAAGIIPARAGFTGLGHTIGWE